jgi:hypothetical protein
MKFLDSSKDFFLIANKCLLKIMLCRTNLLLIYDWTAKRTREVLYENRFILLSTASLLLFIFNTNFNITGCRQKEMTINLDLSPLRET